MPILSYSLRIDVCADPARNLILDNFRLKHFFILSIIFAAFSPEENLFSHSRALKFFQKWQVFKTPSATSGRDSDASIDLSVRNLILNNCRLKHFLT